MDPFIIWPSKKIDKGTKSSSSEESETDGGITPKQGNNGIGLKGLSFYIC